MLKKCFRKINFLLQSQTLFGLNLMFEYSLGKHLGVFRTLRDIFVLVLFED